MRAILFSLAAGALLTAVGLLVADRLDLRCIDYRSAPLCPSGQR